MATAPDWVFQWPRDTASIHKHLVDRRAALTICLKTKDDPYFLDRWIRHHADIVGLRHLVIFDNESTSDVVWGIYEKYRRELTVIQFAGNYNDVHDVAVFRDFYETLKQATTFFAFLDTDEALVLADQDRFVVDGSIVEFIQTHSEADWVPTIWLHNAVSSENVFHCGGDMDSLVHGLHWGKPIVRAQAMEEGVILHNTHVHTVIGATRARTNLFLLHRKNLWAEQRIAVFRNRLLANCKLFSDPAARNFAAETDDLATLLAAPTEHLPTRLREEAAELRRLASRHQTGPGDVDQLQPGHVRFCPGGRIEYFSDSERELFRQFAVGYEGFLRQAFEPDPGTTGPACAAPDSTKTSPRSPCWIKAEPNPIPADSAAGMTTIRWCIEDGSWGEVYLHVEGQPETRFCAGPTGSRTVAWISPGVRYEFRLYAGREQDAKLAHVVVVRE